MINSRPDRQELIFGILGRVEAYKGHAQVIEAIARLPQELRKQVTLKIIGTCLKSEQARLQRIAEGLGVAETLDFCGFVSGSVSEIVHQLDAVVMATQTFEGFGLTVVEALNNGVPVIATNVGVVSELFDADDPMIAMPGDVSGLYSSIYHFATHRNEYEIPANVIARLPKYNAREVARLYRNHLQACLYAANTSQ